jgi:hypothetical protein
LGETLPCVSGHSAQSFQDKIYIFGGTDGKKALQSLYVFDVLSQELCNVAVEELNWPEARTSHAACILNDAIYIHGGSSLSE